MPDINNIAPNRIDRPIVAQLFVILLATTFLLCLIVLALLEYQQRQQLQQTTSIESLYLAKMVAVSAAPLVHHNESFALWQLLSSFQKRSSVIHIDSIIIIDEKNRVLGSTHPKRNVLMSLYNLPPHMSDEPIWQKKHLTLYVPILHPQDSRPLGRVILNLDASKLLQEHITDMRQKLLLLFGFCLFLTALLAWVLSRRLAAPLHELIKDVHHIGSGKIDMNKLINRRDEYGELARSIKKSDQDLYLIRKQQQALIEHAPIGIWMMDNNDKLAFCNKEFASDMSVPLARLMHDPEGILLLPEEFLEKGKNINHEKHIRLAMGDKGEHILEIIFTPLFDDNEARLGTMGISIDVSQRVRSNRLIRRLSQAVSSAEEGIMVAGFNGKVEYANPAYEKISGYLSIEMLGNFPSIMNSGVHDSQFFKSLWEHIQSGKTWKGKITNKRKNGELYECDQVIAPIFNEHGDITGFVSTMRDITEEKRLRNKIQHTQRLESLGLLAGSVAHDFNNLITALLGHASLAAMMLTKQPEAFKHIKHIEEVSQRAAVLCKQMLDYSGKGRREVRAINISELVSDMSRLLKVSINRRIKVHYDLMPDLADVDGDLAQLQQVIMNLITNASDAIDANEGEIFIRTDIIIADRSLLAMSRLPEEIPEGEYICLEVRDTGCGMDEKTQEQIFDPFFTTKFTGRGLGMSAVLGIIRGHKGALCLNSIVGEGTTFRLLLPKGKQKRIKQQSTQNISDWHGHGKVLIIDDEKMVQNVMSMMLSRMGFETIIIASNASDGIKIFNEQYKDIKIVLLDYMLPRMTGIECLKLLHNICTDIPVIMISGLSEEVANTRFDGQQINDFLQKPFTYKELEQAMRRVDADNDNDAMKKNDYY
ncbi:MAG: PAS domain S-box protein [Mariprofundales bacterium]